MIVLLNCIQNNILHKAQGECCAFSFQTDPVWQRAKHKQMAVSSYTTKIISL